MRYLNLKENVRIRRAGFAYRQFFDKFLHRYESARTLLHERDRLAHAARLQPRGMQVVLVFGYGHSFAILTPETFPRWKGTTQQGIAHIMKKMDVEQKEWQLGRTKLFIKSPETVRRADPHVCPCPAPARKLR